MNESHREGQTASQQTYNLMSKVAIHYGLKTSMAMEQRMKRYSNAGDTGISDWYVYIDNVSYIAWYGNNDRNVLSKKIRTPYL